NRPGCDALCGKSDGRHRLWTAQALARLVGASRQVILPRMKTLAGYADRISLAPGDTVAFKVSCEDGAPEYRVRLVPLICTDDHPGGPGLVERPVPSEIDRTYKARRQVIRPGSYVLVPVRPSIDRLQAFTVQAMIWPTLPGQGRQTLLGTWLESDRLGFA